MEWGKGKTRCLLQRQMESKGRGKKTLGRNGRGERKDRVLTLVENAAKKETGNKTLGRNGLRERNNQVIAPVEDAVKKEERRKLLEAMDWGKGTIRCLLQRKMQSKGRGKKTLGSDGRGARNNHVLTPMEDAADRKWTENTWKEWNENPWKG